VTGVQTCALPICADSAGDNVLSRSSHARRKHQLSFKSKKQESPQADRKKEQVIARALPMDEEFKDF
jgi:hypothetical protein